MGRVANSSVLHAGGVEGWVKDADVVFRSKTNSADNHSEMNSGYLWNG